MVIPTVITQLAILGLLILFALGAAGIYKNIERKKETGKYRVYIPTWGKQLLQGSIQESVRSLIIYSIMSVILFGILTCIQQFTYIGAVTVTTLNPTPLLFILAGISICTMMVLTPLPLIIVFGAWMILILKWFNMWKLKMQWQQYPLEVVIRNKHRRKDGRLLEDL